MLNFCCYILSIIILWRSAQISPCIPDNMVIGNSIKILIWTIFSRNNLTSSTFFASKSGIHKTYGNVFPWTAALDSPEASPADGITGGVGMALATVGKLLITIFIFGHCSCIGCISFLGMSGNHYSRPPAVEALTGCSFPICAIFMRFMCDYNRFILRFCVTHVLVFSRMPIFFWLQFVFCDPDHRLRFTLFRWLI